LYVGGAGSGAFLLENLRLHNTGYSFTVFDATPPKITRLSPEAGAGNATHPILASDDIFIEFDKRIRPGTGAVVFESPTTEHLVDIRSTTEVVIEDVRLAMNPAMELADSLQSTITMAPGVVRSLGAWASLLIDFEPQVSTPLGSCSSLPNATEIKCYIRCRETSGCVAFKAGTSGSNQGQCCLYEAYNLSPGSITGVQEAPGMVFASLVMGTLGEDYPGIKGPPATIQGNVVINGIAESDFWPDDDVILSFKRAIALSGSILGFNLTDSMVSLNNVTAPTTAEGGEAARRLLSAESVTVAYVIWLTPDQAELASAVSASLTEAIASENANFVETFKSQAAALNVLAIALNAYVSVSGTSPAVVPGEGTFSFLVTDSKGGKVIAFEPVNGATEVEPSVSITLTFSEGIQAGSGAFTLVNQPDDGNAVITIIDVHSDQVTVSGDQVVIFPKYWFSKGTVSVSMPAGTLKDDPHEGTLIPNPSVELAEGAYLFNVKALIRTVAPSYVRIGASGAGTCHYRMTEPYYQCEGFEECSLFVSPIGKCGDVPAQTVRQVTYKAQQEIARAAFEKNGGDGRGTILSFGEGDIWPEHGVADIV